MKKKAKSGKLKKKVLGTAISVAAAAACGAITGESVLREKVERYRVRQSLRRAK